MSQEYRLEREQRIARPLPDVFEFFEDAQNLQAITPPFLRFRILTPLPIEMREGARIDYALTLFGAPLRWRTRISVYEPGIRFVDEQESGPYARWHHLHEFEADGGATLMRDVVSYRLPFGPLGVVAHALWVERKLRLIFDYRAQAIERWARGEAGPWRSTRRAGVDTTRASVEDRCGR